ncbi:MAG: DnaJ domain-containing protein [Deltaproteobacteria bacterium]|nr:DnaJ domain-containing protein [Deltaproteobacteria bacterium]
MQGDPWVVLGVRRGAGADEIRRAFRRRARELHPDRRPNDRLAEEEFKQLVDALRTLTRGAAGGRGGEGDTSNGRPDRVPAGDRRAAADVAAEFTVGLGEAVRGGELAARLHFDAPCACRTTPRTRRGVCPSCGGHGVRRVVRRVVLRLPPGTRDGDLVRVVGAGTESPGGARGDLRIRLRVRLPPHVRIEGDDLHVELPLTIPEALAGVRLQVPAPLGLVSVSVPAGSDGSHVLRVRGFGLPAPPGSHRPPGHLFLYPTVRVPQNVSGEHLRLAAALVAAYPHDPRAGWLQDRSPQRPRTRCT